MNEEEVHIKDGLLARFVSFHTLVVKCLTNGIQILFASY
jgi:hypothetical protein